MIYYHSLLYQKGSRVYMSFITRFALVFLSVIVTVTSFPFKMVSQRAKDFRLTAYVVGNNFVDTSRIDASHFEDLTDVILIGVSNFNENGEIVLDKNFDTVVSNLREGMKNSKANLYLNIIGPGYRIQSDDWNELMKDQSKYHNLAFRSGNLEKNIKAVLDEYGFDGVFFDYEYPVTDEDWAVFDDFLISLDGYLGDEYKIGCAISAWLTKQSRKSIAVTDMVEVMAYDIWDNDGTHASLWGAIQCVNRMLFLGYRKEQMDVGIPFYARPTTQEAYWYGYNGYYENLDEKGFCVDPETGLTFSFNTYDMVYEKTVWAISKGLGGAMVWHYSCDVPKDNPLSLFNAMYNAKTEMMK